TVVGGVEHRGSHEAVHEHGVGVLVDLVLDGRAVGRDLDDHINIIGWVLAGRDFIEIHGAISPVRVNEGRALYLPGKGFPRMVVAAMEGGSYPDWLITRKQGKAMSASTLEAANKARVEAF